MSIDQSFITLLEKEALKSDVIRSKMSAVVYYAPNIKIPFVLKAFNYHINFNEKHKPYTIHAEESLIAKAAKRGLSLKNSTIIVYRKGRIPTSKPCSACQARLKAAGVKYVLYQDNGNWKKERIN